MRPGGLRVLINWVDTCKLFWDKKPLKGVPLVTFSKCTLFIKKVIRKMHVQTFIFLFFFGGFGGFSEMIVLNKYIYI